MKRAGIIYFSGTGNTAFTARNIKNEFEDRSWGADLINIEKDDMDLNIYDAIVIGGPVYVERYPEMLLAYVENHVKNYKGRCMMFTTQAVDKPTAAFQHAINRMSFLNVTYCQLIPMPNNFYNFMFERTTEEEAEKRIERCRVLCRQAVTGFLNGAVKKYPKSRAYVNMINMVYNLFYPHCIPLMTKKIKVDMNKCIHCRMCERRCPKGSIKIGDTAASFNKNCMLCQRCMSSCPKGAFTYKGKVFDQYRSNLINKVK